MTQKIEGINSSCVKSTIQKNKQQFQNPNLHYILLFASMSITRHIINILKAKSIAFLILEGVNLFYKR